MGQKRFVTNEPDLHLRDEQLQWARILRTGDPAKGMALVYIQKMCTAFHELEPAWRAGVLKEDGLEFFRARLRARLDMVLRLCQANGLEGLAGFAELQAFATTVGKATAVAELAQLAEEVHRINHTLCDALARTRPARSRSRLGP